MLRKKESMRGRKRRLCYFTHNAPRIAHIAQHTVLKYECYLFSLFPPVISSVSHDIVVARVDRHVRRFIEGICIGAQSRIE